MKSGPPNFEQRLNDLLSKLDAKLSSRFNRSKAEESRRGTGVYDTIRDLFTKDVTTRDLKDLVHRDTREAFRYFTKEIDFDSLRPLPWFKRYAIAAWRIFLALAYRLNPARRIAFAVSIFAFLLGSIQFLQFQAQVQSGQAKIIGGSSAGWGWWLISLALLFLLLAMELRDKLSLKGDLEIAREIQMGLVPNKPFLRDGIGIHCFMRPANTVGGDYYDILELGDNRVGIVVGDVAGKGMPAALLMALLQGSLRTLITAGHRGSELIAKLNDYLWTNIPSHSLITLFFGELDTLSGEMAYVNCGHNPPMLFRSDHGMERLQSNSIVLGIQKDALFSGSTVCLEAGDSLLLFTDGITEAFNESEEEFGETKLSNDVQARLSLPEDQILQRLVDDVLSFCGGVRPGDDMTLMLVRRK